MEWTDGKPRCRWANPKNPAYIAYHDNEWGVWDKIEMHILKYYIKRCIGLPGDTLSIRNGRFRINGTNEPLGNMDSQERIGRTLPGEFPDGVYKAFPFDSVISWNIRNFGPLYVYNEAL